eukprot:7128706-Alexandrium_andersonii.AAC.1
MAPRHPAWHALVGKGWPRHLRQLETKVFAPRPQARDTRAAERKENNKKGINNKRRRRRKQYCE